jgi:hypothetical protein
MNQILKTLTLTVCVASVVFGQGICKRFDPTADRCDLKAPAAAQAKCLLRPVKKFGDLGGPLITLPSPLDSIVGQPMDTSITVERVRRFLKTKAIVESEVGGSVATALSTPKYFVIHDTSDYLGQLSDFPTNINDDTAAFNHVAIRVGRAVCHVYINRLGQSATAVVFEAPISPSGTKFGLCNPALKNTFLHIENIQPRIKDLSVKFSNDAVAPQPGFTDPQLERLALVYIVASVRSGRWLIPAYHSPIDLGYPDRHDDPQNFDLEAWSTKLESLMNEIRSMPER